MKLFTVVMLSLALVVMVVSPVRADYTPFLQDWGFNVDGTTYYKDGTPLPSYFDTSGFDFGSGLGTVKLTFNGSSGVHNIAALFDHDSTINFTNERGIATGTPASGQSWEIGAPYSYDANGNIIGPNAIYGHFATNSLTNAVSPFGPDDVAMAMNWNFNLGSSEYAVISFTVTNTNPPSGFQLTQTDLNTNESIYFSGTSEILGGGAPVPAPTTVVLLGPAVAALVFYMRRRESLQ